MRKYFFQAVTAEGKQISGYVSAPSIDAARDKLKAGGLSILTLEQPSDEGQELAQGMHVFEFEAQNPQHKTVKGTIEATELYEAYKKLRREYKLDVAYLVDSASAPTVKLQIREEGLPRELEDRLQIEIKIEEKKEKKKKGSHESQENEVQEAVDANEEERQFMVEKIDAVLAEIVPLLEENSEYIDAHKKREIEERINLVMRLKHSNSVAHLRSLTKRLLEQISSDEIFLKDANIPPELQEEMNRRRSQFQAIGTSFDKAISKGLIDLQVQLAKIDTGAIAETVKDLKPFEKVTNVFYLVFGFLMGLCTVFFVFMYGLNFFGVQEAQTSFFLHSPLLWYIWGLGVLMSISFGFLRFYPKQEWYENLVVVVSTVVAIVVFTVQFPIVFYWT